MLTASGIKKLQQLRANLSALIADHAEQKEIVQSVAGFHLKLIYSLLPAL